MAEDGRPVSELDPLGGAVSLDSSRRSTQAIRPSRPAGGPGYACQEHSATPPTRATNCSSLRRGAEPGEQEQSPPVPPRASSRPHTPSHHHEIVGNAISDGPRASRTVQSIEPASLPVHRSHSDASALVRQGVPPRGPDSEPCRLACCGGDKSIPEAECHSMLAYKQPMQLQQCNILAAICRGEGGAQQQQPQSRCVCIASPKAAGAERERDLPLKCDKALCYGSYMHHANFEDTFAAYCHPQPIPAPSQLLPRLSGVELSCDVQRAAGPPSVTDRLAPPRLISSVSDTGLDAKHLLQCCNLNYAWVSPLPPGAGPQSCCSRGVGPVGTATRDTGTMTARPELRDVGVQTGQAVAPHVFPHICLTESQAPNPDSDGGRKQGGAAKSPVKEVKWDAEGMTWEVYGASVDPEELGLAIQKHLELQIKETASHAAKLSHQNPNAARQGGNTSRQTKRSKMMGSIRTPACCARTTTAVD